MSISSRREASGPVRRLSAAVAAASIAALVLVPLALPQGAWANPFLGSQDEQAPAAPAVVGGSGALQKSQLDIRDRIAAALKGFKDNPTGAAVAAILIGAFLYGILHAAGPGHRKTVIFSLFLSGKAAPWDPLALGTLSAGAHAATGMALIGLLGLAEGAIAPLVKVDRLSIYLEGGSFALVALIALVLAGRQLLGLGHGHRRHGAAHIAETLGSPGSGAEVPQDSPGSSSARRRRLAVILASSFVPCPGATMLLLLAVYMGLAALGAAGVLAMSVGMALVVSGAGYLAYFGREGLFTRLKGHGRLIALVSEGLEFGSYLFMAAFSLYAAWPFLASLVKR